ncbi:hypothetical protein U9M48_002930 [Paspalum notatum var. saurae]|uniref:Uncharacterized protein n=1 Tax=Paspalum notatum var. saurae TaxID=547442 RepID=A0AAQ3PQ55_PASNO
MLVAQMEAPANELWNHPGHSTIQKLTGHRTSWFLVMVLNVHWEAFLPSFMILYSGSLSEIYKIDSPIIWSRCR